MESRVPNERRVIRTHGDVLRLDQLPSNLPNHDEHHIRPRNSGTMVNGVHGRYGDTHSKARRRNRRTTHRTTSYMCQENPLKTPGTQPFPSTREMHLRTTPD